MTVALSPRPTTPSPIPIAHSNNQWNPNDSDRPGPAQASTSSSSSLSAFAPSGPPPSSFPSLSQGRRRVSFGRDGEAVGLGFGNESSSSPTPSFYPSSPLRPSPLESTDPASSPSSSRLALGLGITPSSSPVTNKGSFARSTSISGQRRLSSGSMLNPAGVGFAGSYEASLLSFRFSTTPSPPLPFRLSLGVLGIGPSTPPPLRCPAHLSLPISAHFFPLTSPPPPLLHQPSNPSDPSSSPNLSSTSPSPSSLAPQQTPYLSSFDLTSHYLLNPPPFPALLPAFPGYQLPPKGQLQLVISNPTGTGVKVFLVPYDCEGMGEGERMVLRLKEYEINDELPEVKEVLRGSVVVHICSPPPSHHHHHHSGSAASTPTTKKGSSRSSNDASPSTPTSPTTPTLPPPQQRYYLHSTVRLVFSPLSPSRSSSSSSSSSSSTRTLIDLGSPTLGPSRFLPFLPTPELTTYLSARKARRHQVKHDLHHPSSPTQPSAGVGVGVVEEERGRRVAADEGGGRRRERGEGGGEGVVLSFGKRRQVVGRRKGDGGDAVGSGRGSGREGEEQEEGKVVESELSRRLKGMGLVGR